MKTIRFIKDTEKAKAGEIGEASNKSAESYVSNGYAVYVEEEKKISKEQIRALINSFFNKNFEIQFGKPKELKHFVAYCDSIKRAFPDTIGKLKDDVVMKYICEKYPLLEIKEETEELNLNDEQIEALKSSKKPVQRLGQGVHNNVFYYGVSLIYKGKPISAIITKNNVYLGLNYINWQCENCRIIKETIQPSYEKPLTPKICKCEKVSHSDFKIMKIKNPIKNEFGLNYRTEFNENALDSIWNSESINKYVQRTKQKIERNHAIKNLNDIYSDILEINKKYIEHLNPASHKYIACWIIATYCYTLFEQFGRLYNRAERGSGKTKQARVCKNLVFNPMWITKGTESSQFRDAEATCGTFIVDNMDKLHPDLKNSIEHYIETAWMREATYRLTNKDSMMTEKFQAYSPMMINNILGLDENTIDKTFEIPMLQSINPNIKIQKVTSKSEDWENLRDNIRCWMLDNWEIIQETYNNLHSDFTGRAFDVAEGVLTVAKVIDTDLYKELESYCKEKLEQEQVDLENNHAYMVFSLIWEDFLQNPLMLEKNIFFGDLAEKLFIKFNPFLENGSSEYNNKKKGFSKYIGKIIKSVPMFRKTGLSNGRTYCLINKKDLHQYMVLQHFINDDDTLHISTQSTSSTTSLSSTLINNNKVDVVDEVDEVEQKYEVEQKDILCKSCGKKGIITNGTQWFCKQCAYKECKP